MPKITQEIIDFWENEHFVFEVRTNFNYIQYLKLLIELERRKNINPPSSPDSQS